MPWTAEQALDHWQKKKLLSKEQVQKLRAALKDNDHFDEHGMPKAVAIFATVGAVLIGLGVLLFVGSNWSDMTPFQRIATLFLGYGIVAAGAYVCDKHAFEKTAESLWLLTEIIFGANIMLLAQIFNFSLTFWQGPFLWMLGTLAMGYARQQKVHGYLAVPLGILALGWLDSGGGWGFQDQMGFLGEHENLLPLLPVLGLGLVSLSLIIRSSLSFGFLHEALFSWGALLVLIPMLISTAETGVAEEIFEMSGTLKQWLVLIASVGFVVLTCVWRGVKRAEVRSFLLLTTLVFCAMLVQSDGGSLIGSAMDANTLLHFLYILTLFALSLWGVWIGIVVQNGKVVNLGIIAASVMIIILYFSWSFALLDRSLAFILGGVLLIAMTIGIERKRRRILSSFSSQ